MGHRLARESALRTKEIARYVSGAGSAVSLQAVFGWLAWSSATTAAGVVVVLMVGVVIMIAPVLVLVGAMPAAYGYWRVGPASADLSLADVALLAGVIAAVPFVPWRSPALRSLFRVLAVYLIVLMAAVVLNPSIRSFLEWGHRLFLVAGGVIVGAALSRMGAARAAVLAFLFTSCVVAVGAASDALASGGGWPPDPAYPFGINKNSAGFLLAAALVLLAVLGAEARLRPLHRFAMGSLLLVGLLATQSRGAVATLAVVMAVWSVRSGRLARSPRTIVMLTMLAALTYAGSSQLFSAEELDSRFSSVGSRVETNEAGLELWRDDPVAGVGLKYWRNAAYEGQVGFGEPHNFVVAALGESGVIGLAAIAVLLVGFGRVLIRLPGALATAAFLLFLGKAVNGLIDIYWVAGSFTLAMIVAGMAAGAEPSHVTTPTTTSPVALRPPVG